MKLQNRKIAVVSSGHIPSEWAHSINTSKHAQGFKKIGYDATIFSVERFYEKKKNNEINSINEFYGIDKEIKFKLFKDKTLFYFEEIKFFGLILLFINSLTNGKLRYTFDPEKEMAKYVKRNNYDLAYCRSYRSAYYLLKLGVPIVVETHTPKIINPELKLLLKYSYDDNFRGLSTISNHIKNEFEKYGFPKQKILVQEDAVDLESYEKISDDKSILRKKLNLPLDKKIVTYCGRLDENRGIEEILFCANQNPSSLFLIIGGTPEKVSYYENLSKKLKTKNVCFTGHIPNNSVPLYTKASDLLLAPYSKNIYSAQHFSPIKLFEYMATGVPIIVSDSTSNERNSIGR